MALYETPNITGGFDTFTIGIQSATHSTFIPMLLIFVFSVVFLGGSISQKRRSGFADVPMLATMASVATLMITLPLTITSGLVDIYLLSIVVVITIFSGFWLFTSRSRNEV